MTEALPPKTCSIERLVTAPDDVLRVLNGEKTATRRNGRYADPDELMVIDGKSFRVTSVYSQSLGEMTDDHAKTEGFQDMESYKNHILSFHKGMPWLPHMRVWVHEFEPVEV